MPLDKYDQEFIKGILKPKAAPRLIEFELWTEGTERQTAHIEPNEVAAVKEYQDRRAYGGNCSVSKIILRSGAEFVVNGHVARRIREL